MVLSVILTHRVVEMVVFWDMNRMCMDVLKVVSAPHKGHLKMMWRLTQITFSQCYRFVFFCIFLAAVFIKFNKVMISTVQWILSLLRPT